LDGVLAPYRHPAQRPPDPSLPPLPPAQQPDDEPPSAYWLPNTAPHPPEIDRRHEGLGAVFGLVVMAVVIAVVLLFRPGR
jgi:hypothetical protein